MPHAWEMPPFSHSVKRGFQHNEEISDDGQSCGTALRDAHFQYAGSGNVWQVYKYLKFSWASAVENWGSVNELGQSV
jgi:hypothetical protein